MAKKQSRNVEDNQKKFLTAFEFALSIGDACQASGVSERTVLRWRRDDEAFMEAFTRTDESRGDFLEERMFNILDWATAPEQYERILSKPTLLVFAIKGAKRAKYGESGSGSSEAVQKLVDMVTKLSDTTPVQTEESVTETVSPRVESDLERLLADIPE